LAGNATAAGNLSNSLSAGLGSRGLNTSGIGTVANSLGQSAQAFGSLGLRGGLFGTAQSSALQSMMARLQAYTQLKGQQNSQPGLLSQVAGSALGAFGTGYLQPFFSSLAPKQG